MTLFILLLRVPQFEVDVLFSLNVPDKTLNAEGLAQGNGESEAYKRLLEESEILFGKTLASINMSDHQKLLELFNVEPEDASMN